MGAALRTLFEHVEKTWPVEDQEELASFAQEIEERRKSVYTLSPDELEAIEEGLAQVDRGEFVDEATLEADRKRFGL